jgi:hypothetical protein
MLRWLAVALGCVVGLGMEVALQDLAPRLGIAPIGLVPYLIELVALLLGGYVAGHFSPAWPALHGALAASAYILVSATIETIQEALTFGSVVLRPIDLGDLVIRDVIALVAASLGAALAARLAGTEQGANLPSSDTPRGGRQ